MASSEDIYFSVSDEKVPSEDISATTNKPVAASATPPASAAILKPEAVNKTDCELKLAPRTPLVSETAPLTSSVNKTASSDIPSTDETFIAADTAAATATVNTLKTPTSPEEETTSDNIYYDTSDAMSGPLSFRRYTGMIPVSMCL
jgi:hypothetical protein